MNSPGAPPSEPLIGGLTPWTPTGVMPLDPRYMNSLHAPSSRPSGAGLASLSQLHPHDKELDTALSLLAISVIVIFYFLDTRQFLHFNLVSVTACHSAVMSAKRLLIEPDRKHRLYYN